MGQTKSITSLKICNNTNTDIVTTSVYSVNDYDWDSELRPDLNFQKIKIPAGAYIKKQEHVNTRASNCPFTMKLTFADGTTDIFRINQKYAINQASPGFNHSQKSHDLKYSRTGRSTLQITIKNTQQQLRDEKAKKLNQEALALINIQRYTEAEAKLQEAYKIANSQEIVELLNKTQKIKLIVNEANKILNEGLELTKESQVLMDKIISNDTIIDDITKARDHYNKTLQKYKIAKVKFEEGLKLDDNFQASIDRINSNIEDTARVVESLNKAELEYKINDVNFEQDSEDEEKNEDEEEHTGKVLQELID